MYSNIQINRRSGLYQGFIWGVISLLFLEVVLCVAFHEMKVAYLLGLAKEIQKVAHVDNQDYLPVSYFVAMGGFIIDYCEASKTKMEDRE